MIQNFSNFQPLVRAGRRGLVLLRKLMVKFIEKQARNNVIYSEVRVSPHFLVGSLAPTIMGDTSERDHWNRLIEECRIDKITPDEIMEAEIGGLNEGIAAHNSNPNRKFNISANVIMCCVTPCPDLSAETAAMAVEYSKLKSGVRVVGVDLACGEQPEELWNHPEHTRAVKMCKDAGLGVTIHAGESGGPQNVIATIERFGATRCGHGYVLTLPEHREVYDQFKPGGRYNPEGKFHFESCPTSSVETGGWRAGSDAAQECKTKSSSVQIPWPEHPSLKMFRDGISVSFNTDDPDVFETTPTGEFRICQKMGMSIGDLRRSVRDAVNAAFVRADERAELLRNLEPREFQPEGSLRAGDAPRPEDPGYALR